MGPMAWARGPGPEGLGQRAQGRGLEVLGQRPWARGLGPNGLGSEAQPASPKAQAWMALRGEWTDGQTKNLPLSRPILQDISPLGPLPKKKMWHIVVTAIDRVRFRVRIGLRVRVGLKVRFWFDLGLGSGWRCDETKD